MGTRIRRSVTHEYSPTPPNSLKVNNYITSGENEGILNSMVLTDYEVVLHSQKVRSFMSVRKNRIRPKSMIDGELALRESKEDLRNSAPNVGMPREVVGKREVYGRLYRSNGTYPRYAVESMNIKTPDRRYKARRGSSHITDDNLSSYEGIKLPEIRAQIVAPQTPSQTLKKPRIHNRRGKRIQTPFGKHNNKELDFNVLLLEINRQHALIEENKIKEKNEENKLIKEENKLIKEEYSGLKNSHVLEAYTIIINLAPDLNFEKKRNKKNKKDDEGRYLEVPKWRNRKMNKVKKNREHRKIYD